jgi:hypothetical protein
VLSVELDTGEIPTIFSRFRELIEERHWRRRVLSVKAEIRGNRFLHDYLTEENGIAFALDRCSELTTRYGKIPDEETRNRDLYAAMSFAAQTLSIIERSTPTQKHQIVRRIHGAFRNPPEMHAIRFELMCATHFVRRGYSITWPEMEKTGSFDILVQGIGDSGLEVECKLISQDKGRKIHRREALEFHALLKRQIDPVSKKLSGGLAVVLTLPNRIPSQLPERFALLQHIKNAVLSAKSVEFPDGTNIRVSEFDPDSLLQTGRDGRIYIEKETLERVTSTKNRESLVIGRRTGGVIIFVIQSVIDDNMLTYVFDTVSTSAESQVSKDRAALFLIGFQDLSADSLVNVAKQDFGINQPPTALRIAVSKFLSSEKRSHIVGVGFLSQSALMPNVDGSVNSGGSAYVFPRAEGRFWHTDFAGLFSAI